MATVGNSYLSLADLRKQQNKNDEVASIIEIMAKQLDMLADAPAFEANEGNSHLTTIRAGLPAPTWPKLYEGVQPTKGLTTQVRDTLGMVEDWSEIDARLVEKAKNPQKFRLNEAQAHIMGIAHDIGSTVIYGDTSVTPERFTGLHPRFNSLTAGNGGQIVDAGGLGSDNTSIWFITWGERTCHFLFPEGSQMGVRRKDLGEETKENPDGSLYRVFREKFSQDIGLSVRDWRGIARVANIDVSNLTGNISAGADLLDLMVSAFYRLDNPGMADGNTVIYTSRTIAEFLHKQAMSKGTVQLSLAESVAGGRPVVNFLGFPIRRMDSILETEARIV